MANEKITAAREKLRKIRAGNTAPATTPPTHQPSSEAPSNQSSDKIADARARIAQLIEEENGQRAAEGTQTLKEGLAQRELGTAPTESPQHTERSSGMLQEAVMQKTPTESYSLHSGLHKATETGSIGLELAREITHMHESITQNVLGMFSVIDKGLERILDGEVYTFNQETSSVDTVRTGTLSEQVGNTMRAASEFATLVSSLPQIVSSLTTSLRDTERAFEAILLKQPIPPRSVPETVDTSYMPPSGVNSISVPIRDIQTPGTPRLSDGGSESARALALAQEMISVATEVKDRVDVNILTIIRTLDLAASRAVNDEAFSLSASGVITPIKDPNIVNQLETTIRVTRDLTEILKDLPAHIQTLIKEVRTAEHRFIDVLAAHQ